MKILKIFIALLLALAMFCACDKPSAETNMAETAEVVETIEVTEAIETMATTETTEATEPAETIAPTEPTEPIVLEPVGVVAWYSSYRVYTTNKITTHAGGAEVDIDFFAKLLYREAGAMNWEGQVYTASAILNFCDRYNISMWEAGHNKNMFAVAPYVDNTTPLPMQYKVIDYVLNGGRIGEINHFRSNHYHLFGRPICRVDGHYFTIY